MSKKFENSSIRYANEKKHIFLIKKEFESL